MTAPNLVFAEVLNTHKTTVLADWLTELKKSKTARFDLISESELSRQCTIFLDLFRNAVQNGNTSSINQTDWIDLKDFLSGVSKSRAEMGFSATQTATFVFSFKQPLFKALGEKFGKDPQKLAQSVWAATELIDQLGLFVTEEYQKTRELIISRQQRELLELSTPVVELWPSVISLPLIGTLDSERTQMVMENLLQKISDTNSQIAIIDITGVSTVDTLVAQHLLKTVAAARLMGAECFISGISPQIAQTMVHLGVQLNDIVTKASLADAFAVAMKRLGLVVKSARS